jgi:hypothetical protein
MGAMNEFKVLDPEGHSARTWHPDDADEVERARREYEALVRRGYRAFRLDQQAEGRRQQRFDPEEKQTLLVPPIHAG